MTQLPGLGGSAVCRLVRADEDAGVGCPGRDQLERAGLTVVGERSLAAAEGGMDRERPDVRAIASLEITVNLPVLRSDRTGLLGPTGALLAGLHTATTGRERFEGGGEGQFDETTVTGHLRETRSSMMSTALPSVVKCVVSGEVGEHV